MLRRPTVILCIVVLTCALIVSHFTLEHDTLLSDKEEFENITAWTPPQDFHEKYPYYLSGFDKDSNPVWVVEFGVWDVQSAVASNQPEFHKYAVQMYRVWGESPKKHSTVEKNLTAFSVIVDCDEYSILQSSSVPAVQEIYSLLREYRSAMGKSKNFKQGDIINANWLFETMWSAGKSFMGEEVAKMELHGEDKDEWKEVLIEKYGRQALPAKYQ